ncbi:MAG: recombination protein O N-terminal domain-containing protein [Lentisphaeria bacterium]|nr:recombination protein O N-terminal domain-containing protein [Lentisphaeria bacterium]
METKWLNVEALLLRKTPYGDSSIIASLLTAEAGLVDVMFRGALKGNKNKLTHLDYCKVFRMRLKSGKSSQSFYYGDELELLEDFQELPLSYNHFQTAMKLCKFLRSVMEEDDSQEAVFRAVITAFRRLNERNMPEKVIAGFLLWYLYLHGSYPQVKPESEQYYAMHKVCLYGAGKEIEHTYDEEKWIEILNWLIDFAITNGIQANRLR